jgi:hypothetical protein
MFTDATTSVLRTEGGSAQTLPSLRDCARVSCRLVHILYDPSCGHVRAALCLEWAGSALGHRSQIADRVIGADGTLSFSSQSSFRLLRPGQPGALTWPDAIAQLTSERARAETCVALVKKYGDDAQRARGQLAYASAKADADAVIAGLLVREERALPVFLVARDR